MTNGTKNLNFNDVTYNASNVSSVSKCKNKKKIFKIQKKKKKRWISFILFIYIFITYPLSSVDVQLVQKLPPKLARPSNSTFLRSIPLKKERKKKKSDKTNIFKVIALDKLFMYSRINHVYVYSRTSISWEIIIPIQWKIFLIDAIKILFNI